MFKSKYVLFILLIVVALFPSCWEEAGTTSLKLILKSDSTRLITNQHVDISYYKIIGTGPENGINTPQSITETVNVPQSSVTLQGLMIGNWNFQVTAYNDEDIPLMDGSVDVYVSSRPSPVSIDVNNPVGKGSIDLDITWSAPEVTNPSLKVYLRGPSMATSETDSTANVQYENAGSASYNVTNLVSGSYIVRTELYDGETLYGGKVETVKVFKDITTTGTININYDSDVALKGTGLTLQTVYGRPVQGNMTPNGRQDHILYSAEEATLNFSVTSTVTVNDSDYSVEWYYDGIRQETGTTPLTSNVSTFTFSPFIGVHIVNVVCYNKNYASVGSAEWCFTSVARGEVGSLFIQREVSNSENGLKLDASSLIGGLPGGRFLVVSPANHLLQVCDLTNDGARVLTTNNSSWLSHTEHVFSDYRSNFFALADNQNDTEDPQENVTFFKYTTSSNSTTVSIPRDINNNEMRFSFHGNGTLYNFTDVETATILPGVNGDGTIFIGDTTESFSPLSVYKFLNGASQKAVVTNVKNRKGDMSKSNSIANTRYFHTNPGYSSVAYIVYDSESNTFTSGSAQNEIPIRFSATVIKAISDTQFIVSNGTSETCVYTSQYSGWTVTASVNHPSSTICLSDNGFVYMLDKTNSTIYSYSLGSDGSLTELNRVSAEHLTDIAYSDGVLLAVTSDSKLLFCRVVTQE